MKFAFTTTAAIALVIAGPTLAQVPGGAAGADVGATAPPAMNIDRDRAPASGAAVTPAFGVFPTAPEAEKYIGRNVNGMGGNEIGGIENLLIGPDGRVHAAIIEFGSLLGTGETKVAVPWERLNIAADRIMVNMTEDQIKAEPRWTRDRPGAFAEFRAYR